MPSLVLCKWLELGAAKGRGTLDSYSCVVFVFFVANFKCFCRSMITYTWLLLSRWNNLTMWKWSRIEMVQILSIFSSWFLMLKLVDAALKASFILEDAANAADSSPDAPHCQHLSNIRCGFVCLALNFVSCFFSSIGICGNLSNIFQISKCKKLNIGQRFWIGCQDASENPSRLQTSQTSLWIRPCQRLNFSIQWLGKVMQFVDRFRWFRWNKYWSDSKYLKASKRKIGNNKIRLSDSDFSNLIIRTIYLLLKTTYRIWSVSALPCFARHQNDRGWTLQRGRPRQRLLQAMTGVSQTLPSYAVLFDCILFKFFQNIVLYTRSTRYIAGFFLSYSRWIALNRRHRRHAHDIWRKVYRMVQVANGDLSFVHWSRPRFSTGLSELWTYFHFLRYHSVARRGSSRRAGAFHTPLMAAEVEWWTMSCGSIFFVEFHLADSMRLWIQEQVSRAWDTSQRMMPPRCDLRAEIMIDRKK